MNTHSPDPFEEAARHLAEDLGLQNVARAHLSVTPDRYYELALVIKVDTPPALAPMEALKRIGAAFDKIKEAIVEGPLCADFRRTPLERDNHIHRLEQYETYYRLAYRLAHGKDNTLP